MKQCSTCGEVYETIKTCPCPKRGGARAGAGRKTRPTSKAKGIWCGQITDEQRDFIMQWLPPEDRFGVLWAAANKACSRRVQRRGANVVKSKSKVMVGRTRGSRNPLEG